MSRNHNRLKTGKDREKYLRPPWSVEKITHGLPNSLISLLSPAPERLLKLRQETGETLRQPRHFPGADHQDRTLRLVDQLPGDVPHNISMKLAAAGRRAGYNQVVIDAAHFVEQFPHHFPMSQADLRRNA